jgi:hypothetical protein
MQDIFLPAELGTSRAVIACRNVRGRLWPVVQPVVVSLSVVHLID